MSTDPPNNANDLDSAAAPTPPGTSAGAALMHGHLQTEPRGFWADAWHQVLGRPGAIFGLSWIGIVAFFAVFSPLIASGHPIVMWELNEAGERISMSLPLLSSLSSVDLLLILGGIIIPIWVMLPLEKTNPIPERVLKAVLISAAFTTPPVLLLEGLTNLSLPVSVGIGAVVFLGLTVPIFLVARAEQKRSDRLIDVVYIAIFAGFIAATSELVASMVDRPGVSDWVRAMERSDWFIPVASLLIAASFTLIFSLVPVSRNRLNHILLILATGAIAGSIVSQAWQPPAPRFDYLQWEREGQIEAVYTVIPLSPYQRQLGYDLRPPGGLAVPETTPDGEDATWPKYLLGSDGSAQDVLAQLLHASRLSISIGLVATGIAAFIGVTLGALMGYFGGWVDLLLYRVVEIFMAVPLLFLLIVAAAVLPRNIYVMMAIIGCFTWTNAARFTRAEFYRLRDQDFVHAARALGLPMRSVLFRHMLPNGVTPVLVEASFAVAAAILFETILSYLGLGPADQASWGKLLSEAFSDVGQFIWWLAIFPGFAIFLTVLSLTLFGEAMRDAIDPKLKKAAH